MTRYQPYIAVSALDELHDLERNRRRALRRTLKDVAETEQPTHHERAKPLTGWPELFRVREGTARAVCQLEKPRLLILSVGKRKAIYDDLDAIEKRAEAVTA